MSSKTCFARGQVPIKEIFNTSGGRNEVYLSAEAGSEGITIVIDNWNYETVVVHNLSHLDARNLARAILKELGCV